jgi:hypothetical protein
LANDIFRENKYMRKETKSRIYVATSRPIVTHALKTRVETYKTRQILRNNGE